MTEVSPQSEVTCKGGCHCGSVRYRARLPDPIRAFRCNCSICRQTGFIHVFVQQAHFELLEGHDELVEYQFHTRTARHLFCGKCGVKSFYVPRSHPEAFSLNLNCIELPAEIEVITGEFDGRNWSANISRLRSERDD